MLVECWLPGCRTACFCWLALDRHCIQNPAALPSCQYVAHQPIPHPQVVAVDCGGAAPSLRNLRALPQPEASIWPQILFDMRYQGAMDRGCNGVGGSCGWPEAGQCVSTQ